MNAARPVPLHTRLIDFTSRLKEFDEAPNGTAPGRAAVYAALMVEARRLAEEVQTVVNRTDVQIAAGLFDRVALHQYSRGELGEARESLANATGLLERIEGDSPELATILHHRGIVARALGNPEAALEHDRRALNIHKGLAQVDPSAIATLHQSLGLDHYGIGVAQMGTDPDLASRHFAVALIDQAAAIDHLSRNAGAGGSPQAQAYALALLERADTLIAIHRSAEAEHDTSRARRLLNGCAGVDPDRAEGLISALLAARADLEAAWTHVRIALRSAAAQLPDGDPQVHGAQVHLDRARQDLDAPPAAARAPQTPQQPGTGATSGSTGRAQSHGGEIHG